MDRALDGAAAVHVDGPRGAVHLDAGGGQSHVDAIGGEALRHGRGHLEVLAGQQPVGRCTTVTREPNLRNICANSQPMCVRR